MADGVGAEAKAEICLDRLRTLAEQSQQGFALFDEHDVLRYGNPVFRNLLGLLPNEYPSWTDLMRLGRQRQQGTLVAAEDFEAWLASAKSRRGKLPYRVIESDLHSGRWILTTETTLAQGWMLCVMTDITALATGERLLRQQRDLALRQAMSDELTGLSNRRYAMNFLRSALQPERQGDLMLVVLDLDHFKCVNDTYGHEAGDLVLRDFAQLLQAHVRRGDVAARLGGEEFLLALPGAETGRALCLLDRLFAAVRQSAPLSDWPTMRYTCSAGVAQALPGELTDSLLRRADQMLYRAKAEGRNRYFVAPS